ncbi:DUF4232 domain-containing protein [Streptomyces sp. AK02-04a]|uniref:DUF4232 domain-containing protein n=1 Tax=Streptomyces sp. AK02-04a TaxID=3028649 RepID=UPI0029CA3E14|nr:DUF4232 domain-containing protein [Streptomyces sp. AK02-04a]
MHSGGTMRATTRLTAGLGVLMVGWAVTACGHQAGQDGTAPPASGVASPSVPSVTSSATSSEAPKPTACRTGSLTWTLVLLPTKSSSRRDALLTAVNNEPKTCVFAGYPGVSVHNGKANSIEGVGHGHPKPVTLHKGAGVTVDLQYTPRGAKGAGDYCVKEGEALVSAPHNPDRERTNVPVMDTHHAAAEIDACGDSISLSLPHHTTAPATTTR